MSVKTLKSPAFDLWPLLQVTVIFALGLLLWLFLSLDWQSTNVAAEPVVSLNLSGAITHYSETAEVVCSANTIRLELPASQGIAGYSVLFSSSIPLSKLKTQSYIDINTLNGLELYLNSTTQAQFEHYTALAGQLDFDPVRKKGYLNATLANGESNSVFLSTNFSCLN